MPEIKRKALTERGFVKEGCYVQLYFPAYESVLDYRIISRTNPDMPTINYGPIDIEMAGVPAGVVPANTLSDTYELGWPDTRVEPKKQENMFYHEKDDMLFQAYIDIMPIFLRNFYWSPEGIKQVFFSAGDAAVRPSENDIFGYWRRRKEFFYPPKITPAFQSYNDLNVDLRTKANIDYAEYKVELIRDPEIMKELWLDKRPVKKHTSIIMVPVVTVESCLEVYDIKLEEFKEGGFSVSVFMEEVI